MRRCSVWSRCVFAFVYIKSPVRLSLFCVVRHVLDRHFGHLFSLFSLSLSFSLSLPPLSIYLSISIYLAFFLFLFLSLSLCLICSSFCSPCQSIFFALHSGWAAVVSPQAAQVRKARREPHARWEGARTQASAPLGHQHSTRHPSAPLSLPGAIKIRAFAAQIALRTRERRLLGRFEQT